jgi:death-on-curing protein
MQFLTINKIIELHKRLIDRFGGMHGIRDDNLLDSAVTYPRMLYTLGNEKNIYLLAAAYAYHLIKNHPFIDGNKRIGTLAMITFLAMNDHDISIPNARLYELAMLTATSQITERELADELERCAMANA